MKKLIVIIAIIIFVFVLLPFVRDLIIKSIITTAATQVTGVSVRVDSLNLGVLKGTVRIKGFRMYNPKGFPQGVLIDMPLIKANCDSLALFRRKLHLPLAEIDLKEMVVIKDKEGRLNVNSLKITQKQEPEKQERKRKESEPIVLQIDLLKLNIGKVVYKDFSVGEKPSIQVYDIGINKAYKNITSSQQLITLILSESLSQTALKGAAIYGVATLAGVAILPVGLASVLIGKDSARADFNTTYDTAYKASFETMQEMGNITKENKNGGLLQGKIQGSDVTIMITNRQGKSVQITVSARKYLLPKPQTANGVLYQIFEKLK